jgi:hypothetical protein
MAKAVTLPGPEDLIIAGVAAVPIAGASVGVPLDFTCLARCAAAFWRLDDRGEPALPFRHRLWTGTLGPEDETAFEEPFWDTAYQMQLSVHWVCSAPCAQFETLPETARADALVRLLHAEDRYSESPPDAPPTLAGLCECARVMSEADHDEEEVGPFDHAAFYAEEHFRAGACALDVTYRQHDGDAEFTRRCPWAIVVSAFSG